MATLTMAEKWPLLRLLNSLSYKSDNEIVVCFLVSIKFTKIKFFKTTYCKLFLTEENSLQNKL